MLIAPETLSVCFCSPFLMSLWAPITAGIVSVFIPHIQVVSISRSLYLESFSVVLNLWGVSVWWYCHIYELAGFVLMVFDHYISLDSCYFSICVFAYPKVSLFLVTVAGSCWYNLSNTGSVLFHGTTNKWVAYHGSGVPPNLGVFSRRPTLRFKGPSLWAQELVTLSMGL